MREIKNCPLCGGEAMVEACELTDGWMGGVECTKCGCSVVTDGLLTSEEAEAKIIAHWNKRYTKRALVIITSTVCRCAECNNVLCNSDKFCSRCGLRLVWRKRKYE